MRTLLLCGTALTLSAVAAQAQTTPAPNDERNRPWFEQGKAELDRRLAVQPNTNRAKNVILFVADGNGIATNYVTRVFAGQQEGKLGEDHVLPYEAWTNVALVKTYNTNAQTPDSAPTAGALNTGYKQVFNTLNIDPAKGIVEDCRSEAGAGLTTFAEVVTGKDKSVGIVSTARLTHATPAAVYVKTAFRDWETEVEGDCPASKDIATQMIDQMKAGVVDLAFGGGRANFLPADVNGDEGKPGKRKDGVNLLQQAKDAGAQYAWNTDTFKALNLDGSTPVLGMFEDSHMKFEIDRDPAEEPSLEDMTRAAIEYLKNNDNGYYLMVEAGRVDHANHDGNLHRTVTDGVQFAKAIALADELTDDEDTLIIVTADHSHALITNGYCGRGTPILGLCMGVSTDKVEHTGVPEEASDGKPYSVVGYLNGAGSVLKEAADGNFTAPEGRARLTQEEVTDVDFLQQALIPMTSETHSAEDVAAYAKGPWAHLLSGVVEQNYIFHVMNYAAFGDDDAAAAAPAAGVPASAAANAEPAPDAGADTADHTEPAADEAPGNSADHTEPAPAQ